MCLRRRVSPLLAMACVYFREAIVLISFIVEMGLRCLLNFPEPKVTSSYIIVGLTNSPKLKYIQFILMEDEETKMSF